MADELPGCSHWGSDPTATTHSSSSDDPAEPRSLLSQLRAPTPSVLCRKRSVAKNRPPHRRACARPIGPKRLNSRCATDPSSVTPQQRVKEFSSEHLPYLPEYKSHRAISRTPKIGSGFSISLFIRQGF